MITTANCWTCASVRTSVDLDLAGVAALHGDLPFKTLEQDPYIITKLVQGPPLHKGVKQAPEKNGNICFETE